MADVGIYNLTDTWNAGGTTFDAIKMAVTDTASASGSRLLELLVDSGGGASSKFRVDKAGNVTAAGTLGVTGAATLSSTLAVTGRATIDGLTIGKGGQTAVAENTAFGLQALNSASITSSNCTAVGAYALADATGGQNTGVGVRALQSATGGNNTGVGTLSGFKTTTGVECSAFGAGSLQENTTGSRNTALGQAALANNITGTDSTAVGRSALRFVVSSLNTALGVQALEGGDATPANNTGTRNIGIGYRAGQLITSGTDNIVVGHAIGPDSVTGNYQINIGNRYFHDRIQLKNAASGAGDCILLREAANELAMRNGANEQTLRLYNTYTDDSNYERGFFAWDSDKLLLGTESLAAGVAGTARALELQTGGIKRVTIDGTTVRQDGSRFGIFNPSATNVETTGLNIVVGQVGTFDGQVLFYRDSAATDLWMYWFDKIYFQKAVQFNSDINCYSTKLAIFSSAGLKIGTVTTQKLAFWNATPIVQPTTSHAEATFAENSGGTAVNDDSTFGGYTIGQVVKALQDVGLLA